MHSSRMRTARLLRYSRVGGGLHPGGLHPGGCLPRVVCLVGLLPMGSLPRGSAWGVCRGGGLCLGGLHPGDGVCPIYSLSKWNFKTVTNI